MPLTQGSWSYQADGQGALAAFGQPGADPAFIVRCDRAARQVVLGRQGVTTGNTMTIRTSASARNIPLSPGAQPMQQAFGTLSANDRFLDSIVFSRGRFAVEVPGTPMLVIPTWPEPARVVEECRG
jgi:hypothetical protein